MSMASLGLPPYNPFIFVNQDRSVEIHMPGSAPTDLVDESLFGTGDDESNPLTGKYYFTSQDYPWAANLPERFLYPIEKARITDGHLMFSSWALSNGYNYMDWFQDKPGYRNNAELYTGN
jgi:LruC domain-containing protein